MEVEGEEEEEEEEDKEDTTTGVERGDSGASSGVGWQNRMASEAECPALTERTGTRLR